MDACCLCGAWDCSHPRRVGMPVVHGHFRNHIRTAGSASSSRHLPDEECGAVGVGAAGAGGHHEAVESSWRILCASEDHRRIPEEDEGTLRQAQLQPCALPRRYLRPGAHVHQLLHRSPPHGQDLPVLPDGRYPLVLGSVHRGPDVRASGRGGDDDDCDDRAGRRHRQGAFRAASLHEVHVPRARSVHDSRGHPLRHPECRLHVLADRQLVLSLPGHAVQDPWLQACARHPGAASQARRPCRAGPSGAGDSAGGL
mmetsp:Transcript_40271/g.95621  ORF Transcript_40271/g.95621 Transcript_40271/m.95621 type:complete len:255 (-) Transcript_40271:456-1220(-)